MRRLFCPGLAMVWMLICAGMAGNASESPVFELGDGEPVLLERAGLSWFAEAGQEPDLVRLLGGQEAGRFVAAPDGRVPLDFGTVWLRLELREGSALHIDRSILFDQWALQEIRLYRPAAGRDWEVSLAGTAVPGHLRELEGIWWAFRLDPEGERLSRGQVHTLYCRIEAPQSSALLSVWVGGSREIAARQSRDGFVLVFLGGVHLALFLACLMFFLGNVDRFHLALGGLALLGFLRFLTGSGLLANLAGSGMAAFWLGFNPTISVLYFALSLLFLLQFLRLRGIMPRTHRTLLILTVVVAAMATVLVAIPAGPAARSRTLMVFIIMMVVSAIRIGLPAMAVRQGHRAAILYLVAFSMEIVATLIGFLEGVGLLPGHGLLHLCALSGSALQFFGLIHGSAILSRQMRYQLALAHHQLEEANQLLAHEVRDATEALQDERNKAAGMAMEDALTGLPSRRFILERLEEEFQRFRRYGTPFSILVIDLDDFRRINERWGRSAGDQVLQGLARVLGGSLRASDQAGRIGDEEFLVFLPQAGHSQAHRVAEKIRSRLAALRFEGSPERKFGVTCCIGIAEAHKDQDSWPKLFQAGQLALYRAKDAGHNRIAVSQG